MADADIPLSPGATSSGVHGEFHIDIRWRDLTEIANTLFSEADYVTASTVYETAFDEARMLLAEAWNGTGQYAEHIAPMLVVSAGNMARNAQALSQDAFAFASLASTIDLFVEVLDSASAPISLKAECVKHLPRLVSDFKNAVVGTDDFKDREKQYISRAHTSVLNYWKIQK